jgi:hypothetical protein
MAVAVRLLSSIYGDSVDQVCALAHQEEERKYSSITSAGLKGLKLVTLLSSFLPFHCPQA